MIKKIWHSLLNIGITDELDSREARRVSIVNLMACISIAYVTVRTCLTLSDLSYSLKLLCFNLIWFMVLALNRFYKYNIAKHILITVAVLALLFFNVFYLGGFQQAAWVILFAIVPLPFFFFDMRQKVHLLAAIFVVFTAFAMLIALNYIYPLPPQAKISIEAARISGTIVSVITLFSSILYFVLQNADAEKRLMKEKEKSDSANKAKSTFLANMSHELRTPLNAILGFSQIIDKSQHLNTQDKANLQVINRSGEHLLALINDVLDMSKIESGQITLSESNFDLYRMLDDVRDICKVQADQKELSLRLVTPSNLPRFVRADEMRLRQVLLNLLNNAVKFTDEGGVTVRVTVNFNADQANNTIHVQFKVEDTGIGIEADKTGEIFNPFVQTHTGMQSKEGTGLGLPISQKIVRLMHGNITVESQVGKGSCFTIDVQLERSDDSAVQSHKRHGKIVGLQPDSSSRDLHYRVLIVDDIKNNRQVLVQLLSPLCFEIIEAENGEEAIKICKKCFAEGYPPDLIWMDIRMPKIDGCEATKEIKLMAKKKGHNTTIIAVSASALDQDVEAILSVGCDDFVSKPFKESEIFEKMHQYLGLNYVYEDEDANSKNDSDSFQNDEDLFAEIQKLPSEWRNAMKEAVELSDHEKMCSLISEIRDQYTIIADIIQQLIDQFSYDEVLKMLQNE